MANGKSENYLKHAGKPFRGTNKPKRKARLNSKSKKQRERDKIYKKLHREFMADNPFCEKWLIENNIYRIKCGLYVHNNDTNNLFSEEGILSLLNPIYSEEVHHGKGRGKYYLDTSTWHALSSKAHAWVHANPKEAELVGLLDPDRNKR